LATKDLLQELKKSDAHDQLERNRNRGSDAPAIERNVLFIAMEKLHTEDEIMAFYPQYVESLSKIGATMPYGNAEVAAESNVGYVVAYYGAETAKLWLSVIQKAKHPVFGREELVNIIRDPDGVAARQADVVGKQIAKRIAEDRMKNRQSG
jgi:hypothetical protein